MERFVMLVEEDERFDFSPESAPDAVFVLRRVDDTTMRLFQKRYTTKKKSTRTGQPYEETDWAKVADDRLDYAILDWKKGVVDGQHAKVECTRENKMKLPSRIKLEIIEAIESEAPSAEALKEERKNSSNSSAFAGTNPA